MFDDEKQIKTEPKVGRFSGTGSVNEFKSITETIPKGIEKTKPKQKIFSTDYENSELRRQKIDVNIVKSLENERKVFKMIDGKYKKNQEIEEKKQNEGGFFGMILGFLGCSKID